MSQKVRHTVQATRKTLTSIAPSTEGNKTTPFLLSPPRGPRLRSSRLGLGRSRVLLRFAQCFRNSSRSPLERTSSLGRDRERHRLVIFVFFHVDLLGHVILLARSRRSGALVRRLNHDGNGNHPSFSGRGTILCRTSARTLVVGLRTSLVFPRRARAGQLQEAPRGDSALSHWRSFWTWRANAQLDCGRCRRGRRCRFRRFGCASSHFAMGL